MAARHNTPMENEDRTMPRQAGTTVDAGAVARMNLKNDNVSVVHSGESDPMPNQDAQDAYYDEVLLKANGSDTASDEVESNNHNSGADEITAMDRDEEVDVADVDELPMKASTAEPENPTDAAPSAISDDDNDFEYQQHMGEDGGPNDEEMLAREENVA